VSQWCLQPLDKKHDRSGFDCGEPTLNIYIRERAGQHARKDMSRTFVAVNPADSIVLGYYTLATGSIKFKSMPPKQRKGLLSEYPIPTACLVRLAVDKRYQQKGLGGVLLYDAMVRAVRAADDMGIYAFMVRAISDRAKAYYIQHGFEPIEDDPLHLFVTTKVVRKLLAELSDTD